MHHIATCNDKSQELPILAFSGSNGVEYLKTKLLLGAKYSHNLPILLWIHHRSNNLPGNTGIQSQTSPCGICGGQSGKGFSPSTSFSTSGTISQHSILKFHLPMTSHYWQLFHTDWLMHTYIINTTLLALCYSNMFQPSNGHPQEVQTISTARSRKYVQHIKFSLVSHVYYIKLNVTSSIYFVELAVEMCQSYSLRMALWGPKHVRVTQC